MSILQSFITLWRHNEKKQYSPWWQPVGTRIAALAYRNAWKNGQKNPTFIIPAVIILNDFLQENFC